MTESVTLYSVLMHLCRRVDAPPLTPPILSSGPYLCFFYFFFLQAPRLGEKVSGLLHARASRYLQFEHTRTYIENMYSVYSILHIKIASCFLANRPALNSMYEYAVNIYVQQDTP